MSEVISWASQSFWPLILVLLGVGGWYIARVALSRLPRVTKDTIALFHPSAHGGGGGERVLWVAINVLSQIAPQKQLCIYCAAGHSEAELKQQALQTFGIEITASLRIVPLHKTALLEPERWPRFTMLGQAWGSVSVAWEGLTHVVPEVWIDTTGWALPYAIVRLAGAKVACYVHYPTISTNMIRRVGSQSAGYNNNTAIASSVLLSAFKLVYYNLFALLYGFCGLWPSVVMVNSNWTRRHISALWWRWAASAAHVVYPPCDTEKLQELELARPLKSLYLVSIAQFRPEKNHRLQIEAFAQAREYMRAHGVGSHDALTAKLLFIGGCRNSADAERMHALEAYAEEAGVGSSVDFMPNASIGDVTRALRGAVGGLHSMLDEHFGISIVEYMAAGVVPIAHDSGGPREDIVVPAANDCSGFGVGSRRPVGFRATSVQQYARAIVDVLVMDEDSRMAIAAAAREKSAQFSQHRFATEFALAMRPLLLC